MLKVALVVLIEVGAWCAVAAPFIYVLMFHAMAEDVQALDKKHRQWLYQLAETIAGLGALLVFGFGFRAVLLHITHLPRVSLPASLQDVKSSVAFFGSFAAVLCIGSIVRKAEKWWKAARRYDDLIADARGRLDNLSFVCGEQYPDPRCTAINEYLDLLISRMKAEADQIGWDVGICPGYPRERHFSHRSLPDPPSIDFLDQVDSSCDAAPTFVDEATQGNLVEPDSERSVALRRNHTLNAGCQQRPERDK